MKVALFDMDGTLIDSMGVWDVAPAYALKLLNIAPDKEAFEVFRVKGYKGAADYLIEKYNLQMSRHDFLAVMDQAVKPFYEKEATIKDGVIEYLEYLKSKNVKMCIISANNIELINIVKERYNLDSYISDFISTRDLGYTKEQVEIFTYLASYYGVEVEDCVLFEDSKYAIETACKLNMKTVAVKDHFSKKDEDYFKANCTRTISSFKELIAEDNL